MKNTFYLATLVFFGLTLPAISAGQKVSPIEVKSCGAGQFFDQIAGTGLLHCGTPPSTSPAGGDYAIQYSSGGAFAGAIITGLVLGRGSVNPPTAYGGTSGAAHQWITALNASGVGTFARPACADLSDAGAGCALGGTITLNAGASVGLTAPGAMTLGGTYTFGATTDQPQFAGLGLGGAATGANRLSIYGATSGRIELKVPAVAGANSITFPAGTTDFTATGGASQVVQQTTAAGGFTVGRLACANLSDSGAGCSSGAATVKGVAAIGWIATASPDKAVVFTASSAMTITAVRGTVDAAVGATAAIQPYKTASGTACSGGAALTTGTFDANGTALTNQTLTLAGGGVPSISIGDRICLSTANGANFTAGGGIGGLTIEYTVP